MPIRSLGPLGPIQAEAGYTTMAAIRDLELNVQDLSQQVTGIDSAEDQPFQLSNFFDLEEQSPTPGTPSANFARIYSRDDGSGLSGLYYKNDAGTEFTIGTSGGAAVSGSGTANTLPKWATASTLGDSAVDDDGTQVQITDRNFLVTDSTEASTDLFKLTRTAASATGAGSATAHYQPQYGSSTTYSGLNNAFRVFPAWTVSSGAPDLNLLIFDLGSLNGTFGTVQGVNNEWTGGFNGTTLRQFNSFASFTNSTAITDFVHYDARDDDGFSGDLAATEHWVLRRLNNGSWGNQGVVTNAGGILIENPNNDGGGAYTSTNWWVLSGDGPILVTDDSWIYWGSTVKTNIGGRSAGIRYDTSNSRLSVDGPTDFTDGISVPNAAKSATYTITKNDFFVDCDVSGGGYTVNLDASPDPGQWHVIAKSSTGGNTLTVSGNGKNVNGVGTFALSAANESAQFIYGATEWRVI